MNTVENYVLEPNMSKSIYLNIALFVFFISLTMILQKVFPDLFFHLTPLQIVFALVVTTPPFLYLSECLKKKERKAAVLATAFLPVSPLLAWQLCYMACSSQTYFGSHGF